MSALVLELLPSFLPGPFGTPVLGFDSPKTGEVSANSVPLSRFKMRHCWLFQLLNLNKGNSLIKSHEV